MSVTLASVLVWVRLQKETLLYERRLIVGTTPRKSVIYLKRGRRNKAHPSSHFNRDFTVAAL